MLADLITGFMNGLGFMAGVLTLYTIYDIIYNAVEKRHEKAEAARRKKRRH